MQSPQRWVVADEPPAWLQLIAVKENWREARIVMWRARLRALGVTRVDLTHYPDHSELDLDSQVWEVLDPKATKPLEEALRTAVTRMGEATRDRAENAE
jgi:hypothetical protein